MIKKFKLFESIYTTIDELSQQFDDDFIDEFFDEHCSMTAQEIIELWPNSIWKFINDDEYVDDFIRDEINNYSIEDYSEHDYRLYLIANITDDKEEKIIKLYNKKEKENKDYYDSDMLDVLTEKQLRKIIKSENEEEELVEFAAKYRYEDKDAEEIYNEIYGRGDDMGKEIYQMFSYYVDDDEIIDDWKENTNKREEIQELISYTPELQYKLLTIDKSNVFLLSELFIDRADDENISKKYKFQKIYIKEYVNDKIKDESESEDHLKAVAIKFLYDNFKLNKKIEKEFSDDMWLANADKYNL